MEGGLAEHVTTSGGRQRRAMEGAMEGATGGGRYRRPTPSGGAAQRAMEGYVLSGGETHL